MILDECLKEVTVIGAAGKMGSGIATLLAQELAHLKIKNPQTIYKLNLIDINDEAIEGLRTYLKTQLIKLAEKSIVGLRQAYDSREDLVENWEVIDAFVNQGLNNIRFGTELSLAKKSTIIFEAIIENEDLKTKILKELNGMCPPETLYFTNTSSIPISFLDNEAKLNGRIVGYHFYNPPIVQKLLEIITSDNTKPEAKEMANELGKRLRKKIIPANDIAGFIGNGHFIRDGLHALAEVTRLQQEFTFSGALYLINRISQDFMIRPMGIFQLIDYVGIDVFQCILNVMKRHLKDDTLGHTIIDQMMAKGIKGGQRADGSQKDGFLKYQKNRPAAVYDLNSNQYVEIADLAQKLDPQIGDLPEGNKPWKALLRDPEKEASLSAYFQNLNRTEGLGAEIAKKYMIRSQEIGQGLVKDGVSKSEEDVNNVLINGFYWLYGPINNYFK